jgi:hypothetical protein
LLNRKAPWPALPRSSGSTIRRAELETSETKLTRVNDQAIRRTLEEAGVLFIDAEFGLGPGVRLRSDEPARAGSCP